MITTSNVQHRNVSWCVVISVCVSDQTFSNENIYISVTERSSVDQRDPSVRVDPGMVGEDVGKGHSIVRERESEGEAQNTEEENLAKYPSYRVEAAIEQ